MTAYGLRNAHDAANYGYQAAKVNGNDFAVRACRNVRFFNRAPA